MIGLIFAIALAQQPQQPVDCPPPIPTVAITWAEDQPAVVIPRAEAEKEYRQLERFTPTLTLEEARRFRALTVALDILPDYRLMAPRLTHFERLQCLSADVCMCCR